MIFKNLKISGAELKKHYISEEIRILEEYAKGEHSFFENPVTEYVLDAYLKNKDSFICDSFIISNYDVLMLFMVEQDEEPLIEYLQSMCISKFYVLNSGYLFGLIKQKCCFKVVDIIAIDEIGNQKIQEIVEVTIPQKERNLDIYV